MNTPEECPEYSPCLPTWLCLLIVHLRPCFCTTQTGQLYLTGSHPIWISLLHLAIFFWYILVTYSWLAQIFKKLKISLQLSYNKIIYCCFLWKIFPQNKDRSKFHITPIFFSKTKPPGNHGPHPPWPLLPPMALWRHVCHNQSTHHIMGNNGCA